MSRRPMAWFALVCGLLFLPIAAQTASNLLPLWIGGKWAYFTLGSSFKITGSTIDVSVPPVFVPRANDFYNLTAAQASVTLKCPIGDVYRNGILQSSVGEGGTDYSVDSTGLVVTFAAASTPQAGDTVKVLYRCP